MDATEPAVATRIGERPPRSRSALRLGYVLKRYPRYSETFVVNEILAHEEAGAEISIFSLYPPNDDHFQDLLSRVRGPVSYLTDEDLDAQRLWETMCAACDAIPDLFERLARLDEVDARTLYRSLELAMAAREGRLDLLHAHFASVATAVTRHAAALAGIPYTFTAHAKDIFHEEVSRDELAAKMADAARVVTVSDFNVEWLAERFPELAGRVTRVYNGLPLDEFAFAPPSGTDAARRGRTVLSVGRLVAKKGFERLVEACALLLRDGVELDCRIVGTGEIADELEAQIREHGVEDSVQLLGPRPRGEVMELLSGAALFAGSYVVGADGNRDGLPTVLLEAMALGTPCVATAVTGIPELVIDGETGLLVPPDDVDALALAIRRLLDDPPLGARLAAAARRAIEERFDVRVNARALRRIFAEASGREPGRDDAASVSQGEEPPS